MGFVVPAVEGLLFLLGVLALTMGVPAIKPPLFFNKEERQR
jgi:hypothetical protein